MELLLIITPVPQLRSPRIWGTFAASGGVGATTITVHLARAAAAAGLRTLLVEVDRRTPLREILSGEAPFWEDFRVGQSLVDEALPRLNAAGFALLTKRSSAELTHELYTFVLNDLSAHFDLILIDNPTFSLPTMNSLVVVENTLPSLIGLTYLFQIHKPTVAIINKRSSRGKRNSAIAGFISDAILFHFPQSIELQLAMGLGIARKLSKLHERKFTEIVNELLR